MQVETNKIINMIVETNIVHHNLVLCLNKIEEITNTRMFKIVKLALIIYNVFFFTIKL